MPANAHGRGLLRFDSSLRRALYRCADGAATSVARAKKFYVLGLYQAKISQFLGMPYRFFVINDPPAIALQSCRQAPAELLGDYIHSPRSSILPRNTARRFT